MVDNRRMRCKVPLRKLAGWCAMAVLGGLVLAPAVRAEARSIVFVFGPAGTETGRVAARAAAGMARQWLRNDGDSAEIRRAGSAAVLALSAQTPPKQFDQSFLDAARQGRESDAAGFLSALDLASQVRSRRPGMRLIVALVEGPPVSGEAEATVRQIIDFCQQNAVRVVVLDSGPGEGKDSSPLLQSMARQTGGAWVHEAKALESSVLMIAPV